MWDKGALSQVQHVFDKAISRVWLIVEPLLSIDSILILFLLARYLPPYTTLIFTRRSGTFPKP